MGKEYKFKATRKKSGSGFQQIESVDEVGTILSDGFNIFSDDGKQVAILDKEFGDKYFTIQICKGFHVVDNSYIGEFPRTKESDNVE